MNEAIPFMFTVYGSLIFLIGGTIIVAFLVSLCYETPEQVGWLRAYNSNWKKWWYNRNFWTYW